MCIEHRLDGRTGDLFHDSGGLVEAQDHVALIAWQRLDQDDHAAIKGVRSHRRQPFHVAACGFGGRRSAGRVALGGRAEDHDAAGAEIGAEVDEIADVAPASLAQGGIGSGDVQALGTDHEPV